MEEAKQKVAIEGVKFVLPFLLLTSVEPGAKVVTVPVKKTLSLDEIDEHQPIQHYGCVPFMVGAFGNAGDELEENCMFSLELIIESLGHALDVEGGARAAGHVGKRELVFLVEGECNRLKFL